MTPQQHQIAAATLAASLHSLNGVDKAITYLRAQMHVAAGTGEYIGEARKAGSYAQERRD